MLAGNSYISLAGSEEQINFSRQSPKMLKMASESFIHALLLFLGLFLKNSRWVLLDVSSEALTKEKVKTLLPFLICTQAGDPLMMWRQPWQLGTGSHGKVGVAVPVTVLVTIKD